MTQFTLTLYFQSLTHSLTQVAIDPMALSLNLGANEGIRGFPPQSPIFFLPTLPRSVTFGQQATKNFYLVTLHAMLHEVLIEVYPRKN